MSSSIKPVLGSQLEFGHPLATGLVGYWLLNEGSGNTVQDLSGNSRTGTLSGTAPSWKSGKFGHVVFLPGTDEHINVGAFPWPANQISLSMWFDADDISNTQRLFARGNGAGNDFAIQLFESKLRGIIGTDGGGQVIGSQSDALQSKVLYHVVLTFGNQRLKLYINGVISKDDAAATSMFTGPLDGIFGVQADLVGEEFTCLLDNLIIYNRALSASEIAELYINPFIMFERDPIELWVGSVGAGAPAGTILPQITSAYMRI